MFRQISQRFDTVGVLIKYNFFYQGKVLLYDLALLRLIDDSSHLVTTSKIKSYFYILK